MAVWSVFVPDEASGTLPGSEWAERAVFVREAFSWAGLLFAPFVLLRHRLWLAFVAYALFQAAIGIAGRQLGMEDSANIMMLLANLVVAFELPALRRAKLAARGFYEAGTVIAPGIDAAEQRFFDAEDGGIPLPSRGISRSVLGLFPEAVGR